MHWAVKAALFKLCQLVWQTEKQPQTWERSALVQLYKGKGPRSILDNMRHIHCKDEFPKFFGHLVVSASKDKMISNLTKYQIATKPGHRAQEHLFVLKSVIDYIHIKGISAHKSQSNEQYFFVWYKVHPYSSRRQIGDWTVFGPYNSPDWWIL